MFGLLLTLLILDGLLLIVVVLLQSGKGGGLAAMGGGGTSTDSVLGGRQATTLLTRTSWVTGGLFLVLSLVLSVLSSAPRASPESILRQEFQQGAPATVPQPILPGIEQSQGTGGETDLPN